MKYILLILFTINVGPLWSQINVNEINFGKLKKDLLDEPLSQHDLEEILNTFAAIGDQKVAFEEIVKSFFVKPNTIFTDSLIEFYLYDYSKEDSSILSQLPIQTENFRENACKIVWLTIFSDAFLQKRTFLESYLTLIKDQPQYFPNLPEDEEKENLASAYKNYYIYSKWALEYPNELQYFINLLEKLVVHQFGKFSKENVSALFNIVINDVQNRRLIYEIYLPKSIAYHDQLRKQNTNRTSAKISKHLTPTNLNDFLKESYYLVFNETLTDEKLLSLRELIVELELYDPQLIYLALVYSKYE